MPTTKPTLRVSRSLANFWRRTPKRSRIVAAYIAGVVLVTFAQITLDGMAAKLQDVDLAVNAPPAQTAATRIDTTDHLSR